MRKIALVLSLVFTFTSFAGVRFSGKKINQDDLLTIIDEGIGRDNTCLDEYLTREKQLKKFLIWTPPIAAVGLPVAVYSGGATAAGLALATANTGWGAIAFVALGAYGAGIAVIGVFIGLETAKAIEFANTRRIVNLITASQNDILDHRVIKKFIKRYNKKYGVLLTAKEVASRVIELDESGRLCDGEVTNKLGNKRLRKRLAKRRHILRFIHSNG